MFTLITLLGATQLARASSAPKSYDYVIVGGGPAGLLMANRLSSNPDTTVAVIEAGDSAYNNSNVSSITEYGAGLNTQVDWGYVSVPQISNRTLLYHQGKALGGTTTINGMTYLRAEKTQIDAWEELGNEGWNWNSMWPFYLDHEAFQKPSKEQQEKGATYDEELHGFNGDVGVGFTPYLMGQGVFDILKKTSQALDYPFNADPNGGSMRGTSLWPMTLNTTTKTREDAATALYYPIAKERPNLHVYLSTIATRLVWDKSLSANTGLVASGVEVITPRNKTETLRAKKEVIISSGSIRSPALLEHSGVGNPAVLGPLGIEQVISLHTVGANLQDQPQSAIMYTSSTNWTGYPTFVSYLTASDLFGDDLPILRAELNANISAYASTIITDYAPNTTTPEVQERLLKHQIDLLFDPNSTIPLTELLWAPTENAIVVVFWNLLPFSRGSVHITSPDPTIPPAIDPRFLQLPIDTYVQAATAIRVREFFATAPLSTHVGVELEPGFETIPASAGWRDSTWKEWITQKYSTNLHPISTCAMMSKVLGGVVDAKGRVYGTSNVRVVDASVMPTQVSGHLTAILFATAHLFGHTLHQWGQSTTSFGTQSQHDFEMSSLMTIPRELRDQICTYALLAQTNEPPLLEKDFYELIKGRTIYAQPKMFSWTDVVLYQLEGNISNASSLLRVNHQLHAETLENLKFIPEARTYDLDVVILDEVLPLPTWLRVPALTSSIDVLNATFRISGNFTTMGGRRGHAYSQLGVYNGWRVGDGGPPAMTWQIYSLLGRFIRVGPTGERATDKEHKHVIVKTLCIDVKSPPSVDPSRFGKPKSGRGCNWDEEPEHVLDPQYLVDFLVEQIDWLLSGDHGHEWFSYGMILYEHVDEIIVSQDNKHMRTWDVATHLKHVDGFDERYFSAERVKEYKRKTWQWRKARGLRVLDG
ncbi:GMC oxidoreductase [Dothidotthia symphoricarpi CBS 119687]|uniref:GMC oxidoreductase n=1 Tax=Dothidotthia symphoricarpi CBS 119687 TaxID=1392245 RepID=A0A6A6A0Z8_9PLEO|nr:GMC oxidoreductase [Dothidotthia symphoricarpi CBS 119687]KAF2125529.1 GMC oxidoreductase [Dothidotthia symphoricarpi CBS 119687]